MRALVLVIAVLLCPTHLGILSITVLIFFAAYIASPPTPPPPVARSARDTLVQLAMEAAGGLRGDDPLYEACRAA